MIYRYAFPYVLSDPYVRLHGNGDINTNEHVGFHVDRDVDAYEYAFPYVLYDPFDYGDSVAYAQRDSLTDIHKFINTDWDGFDDAYGVPHRDAALDIYLNAFG